MELLTPRERATRYTARIRQYPDSWPTVTDRWFTAHWMGGNNYRGTGFYGSYPPRYLEGMNALFPDAEQVLHLFSGSLPAGPYVRLDCRAATRLPEPAGLKGASRLRQHRAFLRAVKQGAAPTPSELDPILTSLDVADPRRSAYIQTAAYLHDPRSEGYIQADAHRMSDLFPARAFDLIYADPPYTAADGERYGTGDVNRKVILAEAHKVLAPGGHLVWLDTKVPIYDSQFWAWWGVITIIRSTNHRVRVASLFERRAQPRAQGVAGRGEERDGRPLGLYPRDFTAVEVV